jgi:hypothetical protein
MDLDESARPGTICWEPDCRAADEVAVAEPATPAALMRRTGHTGAVALRAELFTGIGGRDAEIDGVLHAAAAASFPVRRSAARGSWIGYDHRSHVGASDSASSGASAHPLFRSTFVAARMGGRPLRTSPRRTADEITAFASARCGSGAGRKEQPCPAPNPWSTCRSTSRTRSAGVTTGGWSWSAWRAQVGRIAVQPGWKWSQDVKPVAGTDLCMAPHQQYQISERIHVVMATAPRLTLAPVRSCRCLPGMTLGWSVRSRWWRSTGRAPRSGRARVRGEQW